MKQAFVSQLEKKTKEQQQNTEDAKTVYIQYPYVHPFSILTMWR